MGAYFGKPLWPETGAPSGSSVTGSHFVMSHLRAQAQAPPEILTPEEEREQDRLLRGTIEYFKMVDALDEAHKHKK
jgi:hypothetical protein